MKISTPPSPRRGARQNSVNGPDNHRTDEDDETLDRTPWPVNRLSYQDLKVAELDAIEKLFAPRDDAPLLMKWVMQHKRGGAFRKRLLVISALRVWLLRRKKPLRTTVECVDVHQLIHVTKIVVMRGPSVAREDSPDSTLTTGICATTSVKIHFSSLTASSSGSEVELSTLHIDPGAHSESIARLLQRQLHALRLAFPSGSPPCMHFAPRCLWQEFFDADDTINGPASSQITDDSVDRDERRLRAQFSAISAAYRAFCDDLSAPCRESVMERLQECVRSLSCVDFQYCLALPAGDSSNQQPPSERANAHHHDAHNLHEQGVARRTAVAMLRCIGLGPPSHATLLRRETQALARALKHADCVENIVIRQLQLKDAGVAALFQSLISPSSSIQGLALNDVRLSASALRILQNIVLQSTIKHERQSQIQNEQHHKVGLRRLDLSLNRFSQKMAVELAVTLELLPHGLELLQLERCALSEAASCLLLSLVGANAAFAGALRELNLSGNHLGREGTEVLASWLTGAFALRQLDVSRTALEMNCFCLALQQNSILSESSLAHLDISFNRMRSSASQALGLVLGKTRSLAALVLRGMTRFHIARVTVGRRHSTFGGSATSEWRSRRDKRGVTISTNGSGGAQHSRGLKCEHLRNILSPMFANAGRVAPCMVDLSENDLRGKKAELLAQLLDAPLAIARQSLRLDHTCLHDKASLLLLHSIRGYSTLNSLSLEGNGFVKRSVQRKRVVEAQRSGLQQLGDSTPTDCHAPANSLEHAAARALSLLVGDSSKVARKSQAPGDASHVEAINESQPSPAKLQLQTQLSTPRLRELCLKSYSSFVFGSVTIAAVVDALPFTTTLRVLDVAGNECGDALAFALGRALPLNSSLRTLFWDDNCTSVDGFFAFYAGLLPNRSLTMVQMPIQDTRRILEGQKDPPREKLFSVLGKIFKVTERNQASTPPAHQRVQDEAPQEPSNYALRGQPSRVETNQEVHAATNLLQHQLPHHRSAEEEANSSRKETHKLIPSSSKCDHVELHLSEDGNGPAEGNNAPEEPGKSADPAHPSAADIPRCPSPDLVSRARGSKTWRPGDESIVLHSSVLYRSRYPSTMHSWDLEGGRSSIGAAGLCEGIGAADLCESIDFAAQWNELNALSASFSAT